MTINDFMAQLKTGKADISVFKQIEARYKATETDAPVLIFSFLKDGVFLNDRKFLRLLSLDESIKATEELHVDFINLNIIPIFDIMDNDFICYDFNNKIWCKFNIIDEVRYDESMQLETMF
jgi:hypothetical protein